MLFVAWIVFPLILLAVCLGAGLLVRAIPGVEIPRVLIAPVGLATVMVVGQFTTLNASTADYTVPVAMAIATCGFLINFLVQSPKDWLPGGPWPTAGVAFVFACFAAPIVLSGSASIAGYIRLDDTATWLAITDHVMDMGQKPGIVPTSSFGRTIEENLGLGYPTAAFIPLGIGGKLSGTDIAWLIQPYMAFCAAMSAMGLYALVRPFAGDSRRAALVVAIAGQPALLYAYSMWGGVKELAAAALIPTVVALIMQRSATARKPVQGLAAAIAPALAAAGLLGILGIGGLVWLAIPFIMAAALMLLLAVAPDFSVRKKIVGAIPPFSPELTRIAGAGVLIVILSLPLYVGSVFSPTQSALTSESELGNLLKPLNPLQSGGIWPVGDFRTSPGQIWITYLLLAIGAGLALAGIVAMVRRRAFAPLAFILSASVVWPLGRALASPWIAGKAMAIASPALLLAALIGAIAITREIKRPQLRALLAVPVVAVVGGVMASNFLAYRNVTLAPHDELAELESIGNEIEGDSPTLMTESQIYGARHFLRNSDGEGVGQLRFRQITQLDGSTAEAHPVGGTDGLQLAGLLEYKSIVTRRTPSQSRPPSVYGLVRAGEFYDTWVRPDVPSPIIEHVPLGDSVDPGAEPSCQDIIALAQRAGPGAQIAAAPAPPIGSADLSSTNATVPPQWRHEGDDLYMYPDSDGTAKVEVPAPADADYSIWVGGSIRGKLTVVIDGKTVGSISHQLNSDGSEYLGFGDTHLSEGAHEVELKYDRTFWRPGEITSPAPAGFFPVGPVIFGAPDISDSITQVPASRASELCGQRWDWLESVQ